LPGFAWVGQLTSQHTALFALGSVASKYALV